jgi:hypothetical protein
MEFLDRIICGDCEQILKELPNDSVDLIFTSPPYADQRKHTYGGVRPDEYVAWFLPKAAEFLRVLKPAGGNRRDRSATLASLCRDGCGEYCGIARNRLVHESSQTKVGGTITV